MTDGPGSHRSKASPDHSTQAVAHDRYWRTVIADDLIEPASKLLQLVARASDIPSDPGQVWMITDARQPIIHRGE